MVECPFCKSEDSKVLESRSAEDGRCVRRRRECLKCDERFTTYERIELAPLIVIKKSGSKEFFSREKLFASIVRSCRKGQINALTIEVIVDNVENKIHQNYCREIASATLGEIVMEELKFLDPMSYIRYASIFKNFNSVTEFIEELNILENNTVSRELELSFKRNF